LTQTVETILYQQLKVETVSPAIQFLWLDKAAELNHWQKIDRFVESIDFLTDVGQQFVKYYLQLLGENRQHKILDRFIRKYETILRSEILLWGAVGLALRLAKSEQAVIKWLSDWRDRHDAEPWMLVNLNESLRAIENILAAKNVERFALNLPSNNGKQCHVAWMTFDLACQGQIDKAGEYLQDLLPGDRHNPEYQLLLEITQAIVAAKATMGSHRVKLKIVRRHLTNAKNIYPEFRTDAPFFGAYLEALRSIFYSTLHFPIIGEWLRELWLSSQLCSLINRIFNK
jgi:tetratricopeptide (TPR) repeat protein